MGANFNNMHIKAAFNFTEKNNRILYLSVRGKSMFPLIDDLDKVIIIKIPLSKIHRGDIIAFWNHGRIVVHRVIRSKSIQKETLFCQKGDLSFNFFWIKGKDVLGKVIKITKGSKVVNLDNLLALVSNRFLGAMGSCWVFVHQVEQMMKKYNFNHAEIPFLSEFKKGIYFVFKTVFYFSINFIYLNLLLKNQK